MYSDVGITMYVTAITCMVVVLQIQNSQQICPINVALNKTTTQSSTWNGTAYNEGVYPSNLAVDGNPDSNFAHESCTHTDPAQRGKVTWTVDLGATYHITAINVTNRQTNADRLDGFVVTSWTNDDRNPQRIYGGWMYGFGYAVNPIHIPINGVFIAQYVQITLPQDATANGRILTLCEVQIYAICCSTPHPTIPDHIPQPLRTYQVAAHTTLVDRCAIGFVPTGSGSNKLTCGEDGRWIHSLTCTVKQCGPLVNPSHGQYNRTSGWYQTQSTLICENGYQTQTPVTRTCQADGTWSHQEGTCPVKHCGPLVNPSHGQYTRTSGWYQTQSTLICEKGYQTQTQVTRTCQADGTWSHTEGTCPVKHCDPLVNPSHGQYNRTSGWYQTQSTLICDKGYQTQTPVTRTCQADGTWSLPEGTCLVKHCEPLVNPSHGQYNRTSGWYQTQSTLICDKGYQTQTPVTRTCQDDGTWSLPVETCQAKTCQGLRNISHGNYTKGLETLPSYKDVTQFTCEPGYVIIVNETQVVFYNRTCQSDKTWSGSEAECRAQPCGSPGNTAHGSYSSTTGVYQDIIMLLCDTGYQMQKPINRTCQANGTWSPVTEKCQPRVKCEVSHLVEHGHYSLGLGTTAYYQDRTWFTCVPGYVIYVNGHQEDNYTRMCLSNSSWDGHEPQCLDASFFLRKDSETYPWTVLLVGVGIGVALSLLSALIIFASVVYTRRRRKKKSSANELYTIPTATREETTYYDELGRSDSFNGGNSMEGANQYEITDP